MTVTPPSQRQPRVPYQTHPATRHLLALREAVVAGPIETDVLELIRIRASQVNGCAYCLHMHLRDARKLGVTEQRLDLVAVWREAPLFSDRERAALALVEDMTLIAQGGVSNQVWTDARTTFSDDELATLMWAIAEINAWNRMAITAQIPVPCQEPTHMQRRV